LIPQTKEEQIELFKDYKQVFSTRQGLRVLEDLEREFGLYRRSIMDPDKPNLEMRTAFFEGVRSAMLYIRSMIETDLDSLNQIPRGTTT